MDKEREAFEELIDIEIIISEGFKFNPNINQYYHPDHTNHRISYAYLMGAWMVWQEKAQAVPDTYTPIVLALEDVQSKIAKASFVTMDADNESEVCAVDANEISAYIDELIESQEPK